MRIAEVINYNTCDAEQEGRSWTGANLVINSVSATESFTGKPFSKDGSALGLGINGKGLGYYYFGARYYDPELGIFISGDPANQHLNPYSYVGYSPIMYIDPDGLWKIGIGIGIGWDRKHGFSIGLGAALDVNLGFANVNVGATHMWNQDGTQTSSLNAGAGINFGVISAQAGIGASYNTKDGYSLGINASAGFAGVGVGVGINNYWNTSGNYLGGNVYGEAFVGTAQSHVGIGYQAGWGSSRSGSYLTASAMGFSGKNYMDGGGWNFGYSANLVNGSYSSENGSTYSTIVGQTRDRMQDLNRAGAGIATLGGAIVGSVMTGTSLLMGRGGSININSNGIDFISGFSPRGGGALTLGGVRIYAAGGDGPNSIWESPYTGFLINAGDHEMRHTQQYMDGGFGFMASYVYHAFSSQQNPWEIEADAYSMLRF